MKNRSTYNGIKYSEAGNFEVTGINPFDLSVISN